MTALELTIYPKQPSRPGPGKGWADWRRDQDRECKLAHDKRFSDAELAAEYEAARCDYMIQRATGSCWAPLFDTWAMDPESIQKRAQTLLRFASRDHYYEETE